MSYFIDMITYPLSMLANKKAIPTKQKRFTKTEKHRPNSKKAYDYVKVIGQTIQDSADQLNQKLKRSYHDLIDEWYASIRTYKVFFHLLNITQQRVQIIYMLLLTMSNSALPYIYVMLEASWQTSLSTKSPFLITAGTQLVIGYIIFSMISFLVNYIRNNILQNIKVSINKQVLKSLSNPNRFLHAVEEDAKVRLAHAKGHLSKSATFVQTLTKELDAFVTGFLSIHETYLHFIPMLTVAFYQLYSAGVLVQGLAFFVASQITLAYITQLCSWALTRNMDNALKSHPNLMKWGIEESEKSETAFQRNFQNLITRSRISKYPNYINTVLQNSNTQINRYFNATRIYKFLENLNWVIVEITGKISTPLFIIFVFLKTYIATDMTYETLSASTNSIMLMSIGSSFLSSGLATTRGWLHIRARHISQMFKVIATESDQQPTPPETFEGLKAKGALKYETTDSKNVLNFFVEVYRATKATQQKLKSYGSQDKPIQLKAGEMINVIGHNGAGKSIMFNALSNMYPGINLDPTIACAQQGFSLYCEQKMFELPQIDGKFWGPQELLHLLWPFKNDSDAQTLQYRQQNVHKSVEKETVIALVNKYLQTMNFRIIIPNHQGKSIELQTVQDLETYQRSIETMSGGEKEKLRLALYFAMAEIIKPRVFLIDEPYNHINELDCVRIAMDMVKKELKDQSSILAVTHHDCDDIHLKNYDKILLIDKKNQDAVRYFGPTGQYEKWLEKESTKTNSLIEEVPQHRVYKLPT